MPRAFALLAGVIFVAYALYSERRRDSSASKDLFWPALWYLAVASRLPGVWLHIWGVPLPSGGDDPTDGSIIDRSFFAILTVIGLRILSRRRFNWGATLRQNPWLTLFFTFAAASILWSQYPFVSLKRYIKILGSITMALVVLTESDPLEAMLTVIRRCLYIHLPMSIICTRYYREIGVSFDWSGAAESWQGISTSKNTLGQIAMLGVLYFSWEVRRHWREQRWRSLNMIYLLMALYLLKGSEETVSLTSIVVTVFALFVFLRIQSLRSRPEAVRRFVRIVYFGTIALVSLVLVHSVVMFSPDSLFGHIITTFGRDITLTDRTNIWHDVYAAASGNPLLGVGIGGFWIGRIANIPWNAEMTWVLGQAHSGYVDTYLQLGIIGGALFAAVMFSTMPKLLDSMSEDFDYACFRITLFITILFVNITESTHLRGDHQFWFITQLVLWMVPTPAGTETPHIRATAGKNEALA
jgi:O-antigen ligase